MRLTTRISLGIVGVVALLLIGAFAVLASFDWNRAKPWVSKTVGHAIGRTVTIEGDLRVVWERDPEAHGWHAWIPGPRVHIGNVTVGNADWANAKTMATMQSVDLDLSLLPMLSHTLSIPSVRLIAPDVHLERLADNRDNWTFAGKGEDSSSWKIDLGRIQFEQGDVTLSDRKNAVDIKVHISALQRSIPFGDMVEQQQEIARRDAAMRVGPNGARQLGQRADKQATPVVAASGAEAPQNYAFQLDVDGTSKKSAVHGTAKIGGVLALRLADRPFPIHADLHIGNTRIAFVGTLLDPTDLDSLNLRLWLSGTNLADLYDILNITLPDTPPYATEGYLVGRLNRDANKLRYANFTARVGGSDLRGDLTYEAKSPRPLLSGTVESDLLQFRDLAPLIGIGAVSGNALSGMPKKQTPPAGKMLPIEPFRPQRWQVMDADVKFSGDRVFRDAELPIHKVDTRIVLDNALLSLDPLRFNFAYGNVEASIRMDGRSAPIKGKLKLTARAMKLAKLLPQAEALKASLGTANGEVMLQASGDSVAALLGAANGEMKLVLDSGTISKALVETIGLNVPNIIATKLFGDHQITINCAAADFVATSGVYDSRLFLIDTDISTIRVTGKISLATEQLDLVVHPDSKGLRLLSLRSPIHVQGTLAQPDVSIDKGSLIVRSVGAAALGLLAAPVAALLPLTAINIGKDEDNRCAPLLKKVQESTAAGSKKK